MRLTFAAVLVGVLLNASSAFAMRCGTHLVREGDTRSRVLHVCGEPTDISQRIEERSLRQPVGLNSTTRSTASTATTQPLPRLATSTLVAASLTVVVESWTFNFGPDRAMQRVVFYDGVVSEIESLGRGYLEDASGSYGRGVHLGETRDRVRATWGDPTESTVSMIERTAVTSVAAVPNAARAPSNAVGVHVVRVAVETWTYNLGPNRHMRRVTFEDGRVVAVETLGPGF